MSFNSTKYKDMEKYVEARERHKKGYRLKTGAFKWHTSWSKSDIEKVMEHKVSDRELSKEIRHSVSAIQKKRWEINKKKKEMLKEYIDRVNKV